ncbi:MAG: polysaccharide deacetylase family protein [Candidatus Bathyarchaeota archaeon]|nr:MAG: polysaccharide deacetylase family protein [Candidatus Bathyarchaeota archaeon]
MPGIFSLSIDVELAWAFVHRGRIDLAKMTQVSMNVRKIMNKLFGLFEAYQIPVTWNILGHLILDHCSKKDESALPHPDMPRPSYSWLNDDWYRYDPCTQVTSDPAWYGKDIVDRIAHYVETSKLSHEIGCHSFSHQLFGDSGCSENVARAEILKCMQLMKTEYNIIPETFAFPRDHVGHLDLLKESGFVSFRDVPAKLYPCLELERTFSRYLKTYFSLAAQLLSYYFLFPPHVVRSRQTSCGLIGIQGCLAYGEKPLVPLEFLTIKAKQGIDRASREGAAFVVYTHLRDFGANRRFFSQFDRVLRYAKRKRDEGNLLVLTMSDLASKRSK